MASAVNFEEAIDRVLRHCLFPEAVRKDKKVILLSVLGGRMRLEEAAEAMGVDGSLMKSLLGRISSGAQAQNAMMLRGREKDRAEDEDHELGGGCAEEVPYEEEEEEQGGIPKLITPSPMLEPMEDSPTRGSDADENALPKSAKAEAASPVAAERPQTSRRIEIEPIKASVLIQAATESVQKNSEPAKSAKLAPKAAKNAPQSTTQVHRDDDEAGKDDEEMVPQPTTKSKAPSIAVFAGYWHMSEGRSKRAIEIAAAVSPALQNATFAVINANMLVAATPIAASSSSAGGCSSRFGKAIRSNDPTVVFYAGVYGVVYKFKLVAEKAMMNNTGARQIIRTYRCIACEQAKENKSLQDDIPLVRTIGDVFVGIDPDQPKGNEHLCMQEA